MRVRNTSVYLHSSRQPCDVLSVITRDSVYKTTAVGVPLYECEKIVFVLREVQKKLLCRIFAPKLRQGKISH